MSEPTPAEFDDERDSQPNYRERAKPTPPMTALVPSHQPAAKPASTRIAEGFAEEHKRTTRRTPEGRRHLLNVAMQQGRSIITCSAAPKMAGTFEPCFPECPHCRDVIRREIRNPFLEMLVKLEIGEERAVYAAHHCCDACYEKYERNTEAAKAARRLAVLEAAGFNKSFINWTLSTYPHQQSPALKKARDYCSNPHHDLILWGNPGVGKTGLGVGILREMHAQGHPVRFVRATEIMLLLRDSMTPKALASQNMTELEVIQHFANVKYLMVDDLSSIAGTEYQDEVMSTMIDMRQKAGHPTIITFNLKLARNQDPSRALINFLGEIVYDRMREQADFVHISVASMRQGR